jgi:hypothetical protein
MHLIIDGYNLIRQTDPLRERERSSLEEGRKALLRVLAPYRKAKHCKITVVFDGWQEGMGPEERDRQEGITVIYSRRGEKADDVIIRLAERKGEDIVVVTSDRAVAKAAESLGHTAVSSPDFASRLFLLREGDGPSPEEGEEEAHGGGWPPSGTRKKGPSRRLSKKKKQYLSRLKKL